MPATTWKGHLAFGLVSIPIRLYAAARSTRIELHQLHKVCGTRLRRPLFCPTCNRMVDQSEVAKGYEYEKGEYLMLDQQEMKKLAPESGGSMEIEEFVPLDEIDPLYFDASYFAVPEKSGQKAYTLLTRTLEETRKVAVAKVVMYQREYVVAVRPHAKGLTLHTLYFQSEIRQVEEYGQTDGEVKPQELQLAKELVGSLTAHFDAGKYHDEYQAKLQQLLDAKAKGKAVPAITEKKMAPVVDIMDALKKSLAAQESAPAKAERRAQRSRQKAS